MRGDLTIKILKLIEEGIGTTANVVTTILKSGYESSYLKLINV